MITMSNGSRAMQLIVILCMRSKTSTNGRSIAICESYLYMHNDKLLGPKRIKFERRTNNGGKHVFQLSPNLAQSKEM